MLVKVTGTYTGNHVRKVLKDAEKMVDFLFQDPDPLLQKLGRKWLDLFSGLGALQTMTASVHIQDLPGFLQTWNEKCDHFFRLHGSAFPDRPLTPKMHLLKGSDR
jgi:hypothetical protein